MGTGDLLVLFTLAVALLVATPFLGGYIHRVMEGERTLLSPVLRPVERAVYRVSGVDETAEQGWRGYAIAVLVLAAVAIVAGYVMLRAPGRPAAEPGRDPGQSPELAFNTSVSFETNTNWQNYSGETGATYLDPGRACSPSATSPPRRPAWRSRSRCSAGSPAGARRRSATTGST